MKIEEALARESIRDAMTRYNMAGDRLKGDEVADVFTADGILESEGFAPADAFRYVGHQEIRDSTTRTRTPPEGRTQPVRMPSFVRHHLTTSLVELTGPETAKGRTYWVAFTDIGPDHCGYYVDTFRKIGERWLIAHRKVRLDWTSPESSFPSPVPRARP